MKVHKMKIIRNTFLIMGLIASSGSAAEPKTALKDQKDKVSYSIGMQLGGSFKAQGIEVNPDVLAQAIRDTLAGGKTLLTEAEAREALEKWSSEMRAKETAKAGESGAKNRKEGTTFLTANAKKEGVKTLPSGLQYKIIKAGTGKIPKASDTVTTHYRGTFIDGNEFDSSYKRNEPASFPVGGVIAGWTEALKLMPVGSKWQLFIPSDLAYGDQGRPGIPPASTLIFDIELISIGQ